MKYLSICFYQDFELCGPSFGGPSCPWAEFTHICNDWIISLCYWLEKMVAKCLFHHTSCEISLNSCYIYDCEH